MPTFTFFNDRLPDPTFGVSDAGSADAAGRKGPGFASVQVSSNRPVQVSRTMSGRGIQREGGAHTWEINITYNPMRRDDFDVVSSFLDARNGRLNPFFVVLPQYSRPKDNAFNTFVTTNTMRVVGAHSAGASSMLIDATPAISGTAKPGDFFTITDLNNVNHTKVYKVTRVETNALYQAGETQPATNQLRIHFMPPLTRLVADDSEINWLNPKFRVIQKNEVTEYQLNTDNLYQFQLSVEEISA